MARHPAGERELPEQLEHPRLVSPDARVGIGERTLQPGVGRQRRSAVPGAGDQQHRQVVFDDQAVQVCVDEVDARRRAPVAEQAAFDVIGRQRLTHQWVVTQIDLPGGQIVGGAPEPVQPVPPRRPSRARPSAHRRRRGAGTRRHDPAERCALRRRRSPSSTATVAIAPTTVLQTPKVCTDVSVGNPSRRPISPGETMHATPVTVRAIAATRAHGRG